MWARSEDPVRSENSIRGPYATSSYSRACDRVFGPYDPTVGVITPRVVAVEYRVEALAAAAEVSVDTIRFYQGRGLLPPSKRVGRVALYDDEHLNRLSQVKTLQLRGFSLVVIARIVRGELDSADEALVEAVVAASEATRGEQEEFWTLAELVKGTKMPIVSLDSGRGHPLAAKASWFAS